MSNEIYAIHYDGHLLEPNIWEKYSDKYGETGNRLQGWKPQKKLYYKVGHAKTALAHLPAQIRKKAVIVRYIPDPDVHPGE